MSELTKHSEETGDDLSSYGLQVWGKRHFFSSETLTRAGHFWKCVLANARLLEGSEWFPTRTQERMKRR